MDKRKSDIIAITLAVSAVIVCFILVMNLNRMFPSPESGVYADLSQTDMTLISNSREGTNPGAPITIEVYTDFQCNYCASAQSTLKRVMKVYGKNVNIVVRHFPQYSKSQKAAEASECARDQGHFWMYHDRLMENQMKISYPDLIKNAESMNLDMDRFGNCLDTEMKKEIVENDKLYGEKNIVTATPTFIINNWLIKGDEEYSEFKRIIDMKMEEISGADDE